MFKKELMDTIKKTIAPLLILLVVPLLIILKVSLKVVLVLPFVRLYNIISAIPANGYLISFIFFFGTIIFTIGGSIGFAAFQGEYKDKAFEYLFSFPLSKWQILRLKLVPRLMILSTLTILYEILAVIYILPLLSIQGKLFFLFHPLFFPIILLFFFAVGFLVSLFEQKNWVAVVSLFIIWAMITGSLGMKRVLRAFFPELQLNRYLINGISFSMAILIILFIVAMAFILVYRRFDVKSPNIHGHYFVIRVLPPLAILTITGLVILL